MYRPSTDRSGPEDAIVSRANQDADEVTLPVKRTDGDTLEERLTANAYENILPARYLRKDADGELIETQENLFERVAKNIALAEAVFEANRHEVDITVTPDQLKPDHPRRDELAAEVFGKGTTADADAETSLSQYNVNKFAYETVVPELPTEIRNHVEETADAFQDSMENLSFVPNSPTLMNAGDELQQLSACFVDSPADDIDDIHETMGEAASVFQSGGGMGYAFWKLRPYGDAVGSTGGIASGPITFMRTYDQMCETIAQGGARRGAQMGVMRISHPDVIQFIHAKNKDVSLAHSLRLNDPDDFTHTQFIDALEEARELIDEEGRVPEHLRNAVEGHLSNFNISVGVTDDFMDALKNDGEFTFTNPRTEEPHIATAETKELYDCYGLGEHVDVGEELSIPAAALWEHIVDGAYQNGEPGVIYLERVNKEHSFDVEEHPDHEILATNPCVTGDTLISTERGLIPAEELYEQGVATDVVVDGRLSDDQIKEASSVYKTGEKDVFKLSTEEGYELRLTVDHRVMTDDGWVEAENLDAGDTVHIANRKGAFGQHGTVEEGKVLGWLVGDGHLKHAEERAVLNFYDEDCAISDEFAGYVNDVVREPVGNANYEVGVSQIQRADEYRGVEAREERVRSSRLYELAEQTGLVEEKLQVPDSVFQGSEEMARGFLQALFTADGSAQGTVEKGISVRLSSSHLDLLKETQRLLLNFGITGTIYENRRDASTRKLPDGNGGTKTYETKAQHELAVTSTDVVRFEKEIGFLLDGKSKALRKRLDAYGRGPYAGRFEATVKSVEYDGHEAVYDLTEPDTQSFVGNGFVVHNCGEQPLEEYEACNLGHINLSTLAATDAPDWRVWSDDHASEYDSREAAMDAYLDEAIDFKEFDRRIELGTRFLENVVTMSDFPVAKIEEKVREMRKIGLGIMGLAQLYIQLGVRYGSDEGNEIARQLMRHINHGSKRTSHELAEQRGSFEDWADSKYADPTAYREWFEAQTGESADDWADGYPIRNHNTTTIAPTGTTSMVGNTTGGCEPIYNVAYYKNVSDDVQGDEMLVEFDDYFLRVLEANDIDVDAVKEEAQNQMAANEFDGVEGLDTVPDAIGELFVVTSDLSGKQHAAVQCACQAGVDSAISKTCNFPNSATKEDMDEVYRYIYDNGGKGVTVYRDGTRSKQVLTTRADNAEFADEDEAAAAITEQITEMFDGIEGFLDNEDVRAALDTDLDSVVSEPVYAAKQPRPDVLHGVTQRIDTGYGKLYVNINEDEQGRPFELFANIGHSGGFTNSFTEALAKVISTALRSGVDPEEIVDELDGTRSPKVAWDKGEQIQSIPDAIGTAMRRYLDGEIEKTYPQQRNLAEIADEDEPQTGTEPEADGGRESQRDSRVHQDAKRSGDSTARAASDHQQLIDSGESPECPSCGAFALYYSEGCKTCESCGWSEC
jgi:ribonucleoside-diphosphate reductase alpha chain